jgi:REP element-mobilizing transposase RayT
LDLFLYLRSRLRNQLKFLKKNRTDYGGSLQTRRKGRQGSRPISTKWSMHLVLRSTKATKKWSMLLPRNKARIKAILNKFAKKYGVVLISGANVGNHLHLEIRLTNRHTYKPFIRAITAAIAMAITGGSRWNKLEIKFWDHRPFSRIVETWREVLSLRDYIKINQFEGKGITRSEARLKLKIQTRREHIAAVFSTRI